MISVAVLHIGRNRDAHEKVAASAESHPIFRVRSACCSEEAINITENWLPDVILFDTSMQDGAAGATLADLRRQSKATDVPVIFLSADDTPRPHDLAGYDVAGVIGPPFDPAQLWPQINILLLKRLRRLQCANHDLDQQLARMEAVAESADAGIVILDVDHTILRFNHAAERMSNFQASEVVGRNYLHIIPPEQIAHCSAMLARVSFGETMQFETRRLKKDGNIVEVALNLSPLRDRAGTIIGAVSMASNIDDRKAVEARLRELNESLEAQVAAKAAKLRTIVDAIPSMIAYWDKELRCDFANAAYLEWFGWRSEQMVGIDIRTLLGDELFAKNEPYIRGALAGTAQHFQRQLTKVDGSIVQTWANYIPHRGSGGEVEGFFVLVTDVTSMVEADVARLQQSEARYRLLAEHTSDLIVQLDRDLVRRYVSPACRDLLGYDEAELLGAAPIELVHPADRDRVEHGYQSLLRGAVGQMILTPRVRHRDGRWIWIEELLRAYRDAGTGEVAGIVKSLRDITARKEIEELLTNRTRQLEQANAELDSFAYAASHDLKAPLRTINNAAIWIEQDLEPHLTDETREHLKLLRGRTARLEKLLDDLLQFSRASQDGSSTELISGRELIDNVLALLPVPDGFEVIANGFEQLAVARLPLQQILMNLTSNAIKHHDKTTGRVEVSACDHGTYHSFAVRDDGPGIAARHHEQIFKMFHTLKPRDQIEGSGLGLAIVRKQIERAGGSLTLESAIGQGTTFRFALPAPDARRMERDDAAVSGDPAISVKQSSSRNSVIANGAKPGDIS